MNMIGWRSWYRMLTERRGGPLPPARAASRLSAYVYGNILALAAVVVVTPHMISSGDAALLVIGTGATTYIAHVFAEAVASANVPEAHDRAGDAADERAGAGRPDDGRDWRRGLEELRDAGPIASSAVIPAIVLAMGWLGWLPTHWAQLIAGGIVVVRISTIQIVAERVRGNPLSPKLFIAGLATAAVAALIVLLKTFVGH